MLKKRTLILAGLLLSAAVVSCGETPATEPQSTEKVDEPSSETASESVS